MDNATDGETARFTLIVIEATAPEGPRMIATGPVTKAEGSGSSAGFVPPPGPHL